MERDQWQAEFEGAMMYFNSHAHVERDHIVRRYKSASKISTHTLTWSVTEYHEYFVLNSSISTHTLTWSVTGDLVLEFLGLDISTHTLTWSVTTYLVKLSEEIIFQLTRSRGA